MSTLTNNISLPDLWRQVNSHTRYANAPKDVTADILAGPETAGVANSPSGMLATSEHLGLWSRNISLQHAGLQETMRKCLAILHEQEASMKKFQEQALELGKLQESLQTAGSKETLDVGTIMQALANVDSRLKTLAEEATATRQSMVMLHDSLKTDHLRQVDAQNAMLYRMMEVQVQHAAKLDRLLLAVEIENTAAVQPTPAAQPSNQQPVGRYTKRTLIFDEDSQDLPPNPYDTARLEREIGYML